MINTTIKVKTHQGKREELSEPSEPKPGPYPPDGMEILIPTIHKDKYAGRVRASDLELLIERGAIAAFCRADGWVEVGKDPIRGRGGTYGGPERRRKITMENNY